MVSVMNEERRTAHVTPAYKARDVLNKYWDGTLPVNPSMLAKSMGISASATCNEGCSGKAYIENGKPIIEYDKNEPLLRQRFTIAHELGHHILNHTSNGHHFRDEVNQFSMNVHNPKETEANQFAIELLTPEKALKHYVFKKGINSLENLAKLFAISTVAMRYRLINLGII